MNVSGLWAHNVTNSIHRWLHKKCQVPAYVFSKMEQITNTSRYIANIKHSVNGVYLSTYKYRY